MSLEKYLNRITLGDSLLLLKEFPENSIDLIVTDPPYGLEFMGKSWDKAVPSVEIWVECLRVLKDGAFAFIMSSPRFDCLGQMSVNLQKAGFNIGFTPIFWAYASGFPKGENISKNVEKRLGTEPIRIDPAPKVGFLGGEGYNKVDHHIIMPEPQTEEGKKLDGSYGGFQPKPAVEVIIVAMKPLSEKTYLDQALKNGKGITWLSDCKIPLQQDEELSAKSSPDFADYNGSMMHKSNLKEGVESAKRIESKWTNTKGRFPANLLVSDDVLNDGRRHTLSERKTPKNVSGFGGKGIYGKFDSEPTKLGGYPDEGSFSRYFDLDAWFSERLRELPPEVQKNFPFLIVPKSSPSERDKGLWRFQEAVAGGMSVRQDGSLDGHITLRKNIHSTVKPIQLGSYLCTLGSRIDDIILDPFCGSGSFLISAKMLERKYIGIDISDEFCVISRERIKSYACDSAESLKEFF